MMSSEDRIETEVRVRVAAALRDNGLGEEKIALEVLYWLPPTFLRWYREMYLSSLVMDQSLSAKSGAGQGTGDERWREKTPGALKGRMVGAGSGGVGKRWVEPATVVRDEHKLEILAGVNSFLERMANSRGRLVSQKVGSIVVKRIAGKKKRVCDECGRFMRDEYRRCPFHEA